MPKISTELRREAKFKRFESQMSVIEHRLEARITKFGNKLEARISKMEYRLGAKIDQLDATITQVATETKSYVLKNTIFTIITFLGINIGLVALVLEIK